MMGNWLIVEVEITTIKARKGMNDITILFILFVYMQIL